MTSAIRTTDLRTAQYRRYIVRTMVAALDAGFGNNYDRDRQLINLRVTPEYPKDEIDYPCLVVEYSDGPVTNAGVGHEEWFNDNAGILRKWNHRRFEGTLTFHLFALSTLDRDLLADALIELLSFGRLDSNLTAFFSDVYGDPSAPPALTFNQIALNTDTINGQGNSTSLAPWRPEDVWVYSTGYSIDCQGGFYNVIPSQTWSLVSDVGVSSYPRERSRWISISLTTPTPPPVPSSIQTWVQLSARRLSRAKRLTLKPSCQSAERQITANDHHHLQRRSQ